MAATWDPATIANVVLSGGNLTATNTGTFDASFDPQGAQSTISKSSGKYYFELTYTKANAAIVSGLGIGVGPAGGTYNDFNNNSALNGVILYGPTNFEIYANGSYTGQSLVSAGGDGSGDVFGIAFDLNNHNVWFQIVAGPDLYLNWNGNGGNPATNTGGVAITSGAKVAYGTFNDTDSTEALVANFAGPFSGAIPSGFVAFGPAVGAA